MTESKRCSGYKGHWECADEYPDHIVPVEEFDISARSSSGHQGMCRKCRKLVSTANNRREIGHIHPETGQFKWIFKHNAAKSLGGEQNSPEWQGYLDEAELLWKLEIENYPDVKTAVKIKPELPKIQKDPKTKSISVPRETYPKEGYVYIFQDMMKPNGVYKIGSTDDVGGRLSNARTWGEFQCVRWFYSDDCKALERKTHTELSEFKIKKDGMGDEWFQIAKDAAINKIQELSNAATTI